MNMFGFLDYEHPRLEREPTWPEQRTVVDHMLEQHDTTILLECVVSLLHRAPSITILNHDRTRSEGTHELIPHEKVPLLCLRGRAETGDDQPPFADHPLQVPVFGWIDLGKRRSDHRHRLSPEGKRGDVCNAIDTESEPGYNDHIMRDERLHRLLRILFSLCTRAPGSHDTDALTIEQRDIATRIEEARRASYLGNPVWIGIIATFEYQIGSFEAKELRFYPRVDLEQFTWIETECVCIGIRVYGHGIRHRDDCPDLFEQRLYIGLGTSGGADQCLVVDGFLDVS